MKATILIWITIILSLVLPVSAQQNRFLVSAAPVASPPSGMQAWRIRYWSKDDSGRPRQVTGMVVAPKKASPRISRKVIAWTHGTSGVAQQCAPSVSDRFFELTPALDAVRNGYVVVAPDYPGLGSAGAHPYLVGAITARATLDSVQAAREIPGSAAGRKFAVWGESQGGHAALWTGQRAKADGADLELVAVAAGAPPTDLAANFRLASDPNAKVFLLALTATSWSRYYKVPLAIGRKSTSAIMKRLAANCIATNQTPRFGALLGILTLRRDLRNFDFAATRPWSRFIAANSTKPVQSVPVLLAQTKDDPLVAASVTRKFARRLCRNNVRVRWIDLPGKDHATTARQSAVQTLKWIDDRFLKKTVPDDCGKNLKLK